MRLNMGNADRIIRILIAVAILILFLTNTIPGTLGWILLIVGFVFLLTSLAGFCPLYTVLGIRTCRTDQKKVL